MSVKKSRMGSNPLSWIKSTVKESDKNKSVLIEPKSLQIKEPDSVADLDKEKEQDDRKDLSQLKNEDNGSENNAFAPAQIKSDVCSEIKLFFPIVFSAKSEEALQLKLKEMKNWLDEEGSFQEIGNIAYTLLIGRSHFRVRCALVVEDIAGLKKSINEIIDTGSTTRFYSINSGAKSSKLSYEESQAAEKLIDELSRTEFYDRNKQRDQIELLAQFYARGAELKWEDIFKQTSYRRIPMPTYPFVGDRYWVNASLPLDNPINDGINTEVFLHPMLDKNVSDFNEQCFIKTFSGKEFYFNDHVVGKDKVLPGVAYIEMARAAGDISYSSCYVCKVRDIHWMNPITMKDKDEKYQAGISLFQLSPFEAEYEIFTNDGDLRIVNGYGTMVFKENNKQDELYMDIEATKDRCKGKIGTKECYTQFAQRGLNLGRSFQSIVELWSGVNEAIAHIKLPDHLSYSFKEYRLHPVIMDGALETVIGLVEQLEKGKDGLSLPYAVDEVEILAPLEPECYAYAVKVENSSADIIDDRKFNVYILDGNGRILVKISGFKLMVQMHVHEDERGKKPLYFRPEWEFSHSSEKGTEFGNLLIVDEDDQLYRQAVASGFFGNIVLARPGRCFEKIKKNIAEFDIFNQDDYRNIFGYLKSTGMYPDKIIHAAAKGSLGSLLSNPEKEVKKIFYSMMYLIRTMVESDKNDTEILFVFPGGEMPNPLFSAMGAFIKSAKLEYMNLKAKSIEVTGRYNASKFIEAAINEFSQRDNDVEIKYDESRRFVRRFKEFIPETITQEGIKDGGVYLITGGTGSLGLLLAEDIVKNYDARVILAGRSFLNQKIQKHLEQLNSHKGYASYIQADISEYTAVSNMISDIKSQYGKINGVIHAAGVQRDSYLNKKIDSEIKEVLASKILGVLNIDEATKNEKLDFMVLFSSVAAVGGNAGQTDYSYANSFMDYYAFVREEIRKSGERHGKTTSVNWTLWKDGGMKVHQSTEKLFVESMGIVLLSSKDGIEAFYKALKTKEVQLACICGDREKITKMLGSSKTAMEEASINSYDAGILFEKVSDKVAEVVMSLLKLRKKDIRMEREMSEYGFNSLTFTDFANALNQEFSLNLTPALFFEYSTITSLVEYIVKAGGIELADKLLNMAKVPHHNENQQVTLNSSGITSIRERKKGFRFLEPFVRVQEETIVSYKAVPIDEEPIAIIGMSGVMPKSEDLDEFWENIKAEKDLISEIPPDRWDWKAYYSEDGSCPNTTYAKWGGFMKDVDKFDNTFFGISPREAELMDPQQRIFMETVWKTIEMSGYKPSDLSGTKTGLFVGVSTMDYYDIIKENNVNLDAHVSTGISHCILANRISYLLNINGPSEPIDTACSSSLIAIHRAVESIRNGDCDMALAGGVNVMLSPMLFITFGKAGMLSKDGRCKTFDKSANGYVRGEGVGAVFLKPMKKAIADGDHIYALIKSTTVNHGGKANTLTSPNPNAQTELLYKAYTKARIDPSTIGYIEAHGTGTSLGDPIEINGLKKAFEMLYEKWELQKPSRPHCAIGSVKTNIGHLETAAGIAGILKVVLSLNNKKIPGNVHLQEINPYIQLDDSPFFIAEHTMEWDAIKDKDGRELPRRAGISSFGFGGANAHIVLEEYPDKSFALKEEKGQRLFVLSAKNVSQLKKYSDKLALFLSCRKKGLKGGKRDSDKELIEGIKKTVLKSVAEIACVSEENISANDALDDIGIDILAASRMTEILSDRFGLDYEAKALLEYPTLRDIVASIAERFKSACETAFTSKEGNTEETDANETVGLDEIAYTLQTGREAMEERLAIVAENKEELANKLFEFSRADNLLDNVYRGSVKNGDIQTGILLDGRAGKEFLRIIIEERELNKIAQLWVMGVNIDWNLMYQVKTPARVSLPTYPFERKRLWFDSFRKKNQDVKGFLPKKEVTNPEIARLGAGSSIKIIKSSAAEGIDWESKALNYRGNEVGMEILDGCIAIVRMEDRKNRNMFTDGVIFGLLSKFLEIKKRGDIKTIIVTGYDNVFSMGGTQEQLLGIANNGSKFTDIPFLYSGLLEAEVPVISAIQGHASGGGLLFALYGDIIIMAEEGVYSAVFTKYGFTPGMGATFILKEKLGINLATEMMYTAKSFEGTDLKNRGASVIFKAGSEVLSSAVSIARMLSEKPVNTLKVLKKELSGRILEQLPYYLQKEIEMHESTFTNPDVQKRIERYYGSTLGNQNKLPSGNAREKSDFKITKEIDNKDKVRNSGDNKITEKFIEKLLNDVENGIITPDEAMAIKENIVNLMQNERYE